MPEFKSLPTFSRLQDTMPANIDRRALGRLLKAPTFSPTDCPNFITYKNYNQYRWYARIVSPMLLAFGGGPLFVGNRVSTISGESPCETWMVVRYPSHRRMLQMALNPFYMLIANPFRARGTAALQLAFTQPRSPNPRLARERQVLALHVNSENSDGFLETVAELVKGTDLHVVYESEVRLDFDFIRHPKANDPNPLTYPTTVALAGPSAKALQTFAERADVQALLATQNKACAQLYERADKFEYLRFGPSPHLSELGRHQNRG